jgi:hypothetical protein
MRTALLAIIVVCLNTQALAVDDPPTAKPDSLAVLDPADAQAQALLDKPLPQVKFDNVAFTDAIDFFRDISGANIFVNTRAMQAAGIDRNSPVTAQMKNVKLSKAIRVVLDDLAGQGRLDYIVDEGVITISTVEDLGLNVSTHVYDVRSLLKRGAGGGFVDDDPPSQALCRLVTDATVAIPLKGNTSSATRPSVAVRCVSGQLIVTTTPGNQARIEKMLAELKDLTGATTRPAGDAEMPLVAPPHVAKQR